jgi:hypothetical protein
MMSGNTACCAVLCRVLCGQVPAGRRSVLDAYGEIILRGWREAVGACLPEIENNLIQVRVLGGGGLMGGEGLPRKAGSGGGQACAKGLGACAKGCLRVCWCLFEMEKPS